MRSTPEPCPREHRRVKGTDRAGAILVQRGKLLTVRGEEGACGGTPEGRASEGLNGILLVGPHSQLIVTDGYQCSSIRLPC